MNIIFIRKKNFIFRLLNGFTKVRFATLISRFIICFRLESDQYRCWCTDCSEILIFYDIPQVRQCRKIIQPEDLKKIWLRDINQLGRRYIRGWVRRGLNMLDFSSNELDSFLYLLKLSGRCNFAKRDIIYDNIIIQVPESARCFQMDRKRFNFIIIM